MGFCFFRLPEVRPTVFPLRCNAEVQVQTPSGIQSLKTLCLQHLPYYTYLTLIYSVFRVSSLGLLRTSALTVFLIVLHIYTHLIRP